ncbi:sensor histidine kinase [Rheinheimera sediminis]|uniref:sensor histidine kinase n=1 Tax=Rheinheimera sp. YQF-1 TaxID=2499626 RepID=UPI000FD94319|nr:histidine kinase [Rheinheimera sp. YQF-1]RVT45582.1 sensor histidine kinase [Rheinheimera sp. YQF-1]
MQHRDPSVLLSKPPALFGWPRLRVVILASTVLTLLWLPIFQSSWLLPPIRVLFVGCMQLLAFGIVERWPKRLPGWVARWVLQVVAVAVVTPFAAVFIYSLTTFSHPEVWSLDSKKMLGFGMLVAAGLLVSPWIAMSALYRHINGQAQQQALSFELERSQLARDALDSRLRLLQAQVEPHFLFNTLANVRELVDSGSSQASQVLNSLITYLRAAVPNLHHSATTLGQELELVRAYLELMHMRMPDRLQFAIDADPAALAVQCPPMTLLTLVENAIRHGIDPSEEGGQIEVTARLQDGRCLAQVKDTGIGLSGPALGGPAVGGKAESQGLGTGLANLRERLHLIFADQAQLSLMALEPHGFCVNISIPALQVTATTSGLSGD